MINFVLFGVGFIGSVHLKCINSNPRTQLTPSLTDGLKAQLMEAAVKSLKENHPVRLDEV